MISWIIFHCGLSNLFKLDDSYSKAAYIGHNHLIITIGSNIIEVVWIIISNLITDAAVQSSWLLNNSSSQCPR